MDATQNPMTALKLGHVFNLIHDILGRATYTDFIYDNCLRLVNEIMRTREVLIFCVFLLQLERLLFPETSPLYSKHKKDTRTL